MNRLTVLGLAFLLSGGFLVIWTAPNMGSEVVGRGTIDPNDENTTLGPYDLSRGTYTFWIEDNGEGSAEGIYDIYLSYGNTDMFADVPEEPRTEEWEGVRCELDSVFAGVPSGFWRVEIQNFDMPTNETEEVRVFLVRSPATSTVGILALGSTLLFAGILTTVLARRPKQE
jgi:hypothetical protein